MSQTKAELINAKGDAAFDTDTLYIDSTNNRVGLGTSSPGALLHLNQATSASEQEHLRIVGGQRTADNFAYGVRILTGATSVNGNRHLRIINTGDTTFQHYETSTGNPAVDRNILLCPSGGRVGVGTTSPSTRLHVADGSGILVQDTGGTERTTQLFQSGNSFYVDLRDGASNGQLVIRGKAGGSASEYARFDTSGRLLVGTSTAPTTGGWNQYAKVVNQGNTGGAANGGVLAMNRGTAAASMVVDQQLGVISFGDSAGNEFGTIICQADAQPGNNDYPGRLVFSTTADGASSPTERMRITQAGDVLIGTVTAYGTGVTLRRNATSQFTTTITGTTSAFVVATGTYDPAMAVRGNGGIANYSANNANLSDRNSKKDIAPAADTWDCIKEWEIVNYRYKDQAAESDLNIGVIAQQVAESCPEVITVFEEAKDDQPEKLGVKEQQMYWMAIKALQEAQVRIETLEAKVAALEAA